MDTNQMPRFKTVQFAYASSEIADDENMPNGCWYVATMDDQHDLHPDIKYASESKADCIKFADCLSCAWAIWSQHND